MSSTQNRQDSQATQEPGSQATQSPATGWAQVVTDNIKIIGAAIAAVILIAALFSGYSYYKTQTLRNAQENVDRITSTQSGEARISALEEFLPQAPEEMRTALHLQLARLCMQEETFDRAIPHWEHLAENSSDQDLQIVAAIGRATALAASGNTGEALDLLQRTAEHAPQRYQRSLQMKIASTAERAGRWEQALKAYQALADMDLDQEQPDEFIEHKIKRMQEKTGNQQS